MALLGWGLALAQAALCAPGPLAWVPARWDGGPLEIVRRTAAKTLPAAGPQRAAIAGWYDPATLRLIEGTPINCLLLTLSAGGPPAVETEQQRLVAAYTRAARDKGIAVLGLVHLGADPAAISASVIAAQLDGVVLEGSFPAGFTAQLERSLRAAGSRAPVIPISQSAAAARAPAAPLVAVQGVRPEARNLSDSGVNAGASAEPWIDSNIWLVRSFRRGERSPLVWINQEPNASVVGDYVRCVADAALAGGRWIVALDDELRAGLLQNDSRALDTWKSIGAYLRFSEEHRDWRPFAPYGNLAIVVDPAGANTDLSEEYLNLVARRQVPYRIIERSALNAACLSDFKAVLAADLAPPTAGERELLRNFAERGGMVIVGGSWGDPPKDDAFAERPVGKGRLIVYKENPPDPEAVSKDLLDLLPPEVMGLSTFNVPSAITYASTAPAGRRALVQMLNYAGTPSMRVTLRFNGVFRKATLHTPEAGPFDLPVREAAGGRTEILIPKLEAWAAVLFE